MKPSGGGPTIAESVAERRAEYVLLETLSRICIVRHMAADATRLRRRATLADVAAAAAVSRATASRALGDSPNDSPATRERVWAAANRLGFEANPVARSLRLGSTMAVGLVVPDVAAGFYAAVLKGVQEVLEPDGYHVLVVSSERTASRERAALRTLRGHRVDGVIVASYGGYEDIGVPAAFFDDIPAGAGVGAVALANQEGVALLVEHLVGVHGHRRI